MLEFATPGMPLWYDLLPHITPPPGSSIVHPGFDGPFLMLHNDIPGRDDERLYSVWSGAQCEEVFIPASGAAPNLDYPPTLLWAAKKLEIASWGEDSLDEIVCLNGYNDKRLKELIAQGLRRYCDQ